MYAQQRFLLQSCLIKLVNVLLKKIHLIKDNATTEPIDLLGSSFPKADIGIATSRDNTEAKIYPSHHAPTHLGSSGVKFPL